MKVAIFENEYEELRRAFDGFNLIYFAKKLTFTVFANSQDITIEELSDYDYIVVDIDLSVNSHLDGFQLIEKIIHTKSLENIKLIILTGQPTIKEKLKQKKLPQFPIIQKPVIFNQINTAFTEVKSIKDYNG